MKVLAIGNSYSRDGTRYLHQIAKAAGDDIKVVNLYIGGCPLSEHYINAMEDRKHYCMEFNGYSTNFFVSIKEALLTESWDGWDVITLQQQSSRSTDHETFNPYITYLADYVRRYSPKAKLYLQQTWGYKPESATLKNIGYATSEEMFNDVKKSYDLAKKDINAYGIIPSGEALNNLLKNGAKCIHRDDIHASLGLGRFTLGLTWYEALTGKSTENIEFSDFDEPVSQEEIQLAKKSAHEAVIKY